MSLLYRILEAFFITLFFSYGISVNAQITSISEQRSRENVIRINSISWEKISDKEKLNLIDSLHTVAEEQEDERLLWYLKAYQYFTNKPVPGNPDARIRRYESLLRLLLSDCPVTEVIAHFRCEYASYSLENKRYESGFKALFLAKEQFDMLGYNNLPCAGPYLYTIGLGYYLNEDYGNTIKNLELGLKYKFFEPLTSVLLRNTLGMAYLKTGQYKLAKNSFGETIKLAAAIGDSAYIGIGIGNYGNTLRQEKLPKQALPFLYKSILINSRREPGSAALTCVYAAKALLALDSLKEAKRFIDMSVPLSGKNTSYNTTNYHRHYLEAASLYYRKVGNNKLAISFLDSTISLKDSLRHIFNKKIVAVTTWALDAERQRATIAENENSRKAIIRVRNGVLVVTLIIFIGILYVLYQRHLKLTVEKRILELDKQKAESVLADATEQLNSYLKSIQEKNQLIEDVNVELNQLKTWTVNSAKNIERTNEIEERRTALIASVILTEKDWIQFQRLFDFVYPDYLENLKSKYPGLTPNETRLIVLLHLEISNKQMAFILGVSLAAIRKSRQRLRKKLDAIDPEHGLLDPADNEVTH